MKIAHLNYFPYFVPGLDKKIKEQAYASKDLGIDIEFVILNQDINKIQDNIIYKKIKKSSILKQKLFRFKVIKENFNFDNYDLIILRYPMTTDFSSQSFIKRYGYKIISEHHTDEIGELKTLGNSISNKFRIFLENKFSKIYLENVKSIIGVTNEIRILECNKSFTPKKSFVFSNGIDVNKVKIANRIRFTNELNAIFVASVFSPWQGLDRVLKGLINYSSNIKINIKLIGKIPKEYDELIIKLQNKNNIYIILKDYVEPKNLNIEYDNQHLAIGTLTQFRTNMQESCPLKVREYIASGIPFIYAYNDSDLNGSEYFTLKLESNDNPIDFEKVIEFAKKIDLEENLQEDMRKFALEKLDWKVKISSLYKFIKNEL
ncbi:glycosyltransferase family protein [Aliarcobacter cryaerophilus]|uniref:glycosyltransferase family 1 protein n=1 Tax=Aliarcobacter cryaerophilus TaxID=28198 RepID=UPI0008242F7F|nr:glycosyltransferase family 1 protein [Aliarcobacter cryaerophilus]